MIRHNLSSVYVSCLYFLSRSQNTVYQGLFCQVALGNSSPLNHTYNEFCTKKEVYSKRFNLLHTSKVQSSYYPSDMGEYYSYWVLQLLKLKTAYFNIFFWINTHHPTTKQLNLHNFDNIKKVISTWIPLLSKCLKSIGLIKNLQKKSNEN